MEIFSFIIIVAVFIGLAIAAKKVGVKKDRSDEVIAGVCAGIAKKFDVPALAVRVAFVFSVLFLGIGVIPYIVLWAVLEEEE